MAFFEKLRALFILGVGNKSLRISGVARGKDNSFVKVASVRQSFASPLILKMPPAISSCAKYAEQSL